MKDYILRKIAKYLIYLSFLTTLLVLPTLFIFPYVVPKVIFFRSVILLVSGVTLVLYLYSLKLKNNSKNKLFTPISVSLALFLLSLTVSTFLGFDWYRSLWDTQERMLGLSTLVFYFIFFFVIKYIFNSWKEWRDAFVVFGGVGIIVSLIGIIQKINLNFLFNRGAVRVVSTLGNPIYLGGLGLFLLFAGLLFFFKEKGWVKWYFAGVSFLGFASIITSGTRGSLLGMLAGFVFISVFYIVLKQGQQKTRNIILGILILGSVMGIGLLTFKDTSLVKSVSTLDRIAHTSPFEGTARTRILAWEVAVEGWKEKPLIGWGPNNYYYAFNKYYNPEFLTFGFQETWFDNAHSVLFNTLATQGVFGLLSYLLIFGASGFCLWKVYKRNEEEVFIFLFGSGFLIAHFVHNMFVFENVTSYIYFFFFLGFLDFVFSGISEKDKNYYNVPKLAIALSLLLAVTGIFFLNVNVVGANITEFKSRKFMSVGDSKNSLQMFNETFKWKSPYQYEIGWDYSMDVLYVIPNIYSYDQKLARELFDLAIVNMVKIMEHSPNDVRSVLAYMDLMRSGGIVLFDIPGAQEDVKDKLELAEKLSPGRQQIEYAKITFLAGIGEIDEAIKMAEEVLSRNENIAEAYYQLARIYEFNEQHKEVLPVLDRAISKGLIFTDPVHQIFAAEAYEFEGRFEDALYWYNMAYKSTGNERIKFKRDELSRMTQKPVPQSLEEFFNFSK